MVTEDIYYLDLSRRNYTHFFSIPDGYSIVLTSMHKWTFSISKTPVCRRCKFQFARGRQYYRCCMYHPIPMGVDWLFLLSYGYSGLSVMGQGDLICQQSTADWLLPSSGHGPTLATWRLTSSDWAVFFSITNQLTHNALVSQGSHA